MDTKPHSFRLTLKYAGAFIAWMIGSGFATGQEILQFFASYGNLSFAVIAVDFLGFLSIGLILLLTGFEHREEPVFDHYRHYCGRVIGKIYALVIPATVFLLMAVIISASGATLKQYFGLPTVLGSALMALLVLSAYLIGFEKMERIVSFIGPCIIVFAVFVGVFSCIRDLGSAANALSVDEELLVPHRASPHFLLSAFLYLSLNLLCGSTYYTQVGRTAKNRASLRRGTILGVVFAMLTITAMSTAILLNAENASSLSVPTLYLAERISPVFGGIFSAALICGMFSSCCTMMWTFCSGFFRNDQKKNRVFSIGAALMAFLLGLFPFQGLVSVIYPLIGYAGLFFIGAVLYDGLRKVLRRNKN